MRLQDDHDPPSTPLECKARSKEYFSAFPGAIKVMPPPALGGIEIQLVCNNVPKLTKGSAVLPPQSYPP